MEVELLQGVDNLMILRNGSATGHEGSELKPGSSNFQLSCTDWKVTLLSRYIFIVWPKMNFVPWSSHVLRCSWPYAECVVDRLG